MITCYEQRTNGNEAFKPTVYEITVKRALNKFLLFEVGYGGLITELEPTKVSILTTIMDTKDVMTLSGTEEEMLPIVEAAACAVVSHPFGKHAPAPFQDAVLQDIMAKTKGLPLLLKMGSGILMGTPYVKAAMVLMLVGETGDEEIVKRLVKMNKDDLFTLVDLVKVDKMSLEDVLELALA